MVWPLLQSLKGTPRTFKELADVVLEQLVSAAVFHSSKRLDFVTNRYPSLSTKTAERQKRALKIYGPSQDVPKQWKKFLSLGQNKEQLVEILFTCWCDANPNSLRNVQLLVTHKELCHKIWSVNNILEVTLLPELTCDPEEADTRLLLHAKHSKTWKPLWRISWAWWINWPISKPRWILGILCLLPLRFAKWDGCQLRKIHSIYGRKVWRRKFTTKPRFFAAAYQACELRVFHSTSMLWSTYQCPKPCGIWVAELWKFLADPLALNACSTREPSAVYQLWVQDRMRLPEVLL